MNLLDFISKQDQDKFVNFMQIKQKEILFHENDSCQSIYIVLKGCIQIVTYSLEGEEEIINTFHSNDVFANALIFSSNNRFLGEVIAKQDSLLAYIEKKDLVFLLQNNQKFMEQYLNLISEKTILLTIKNKLLSHKNIRSRIIYFLEINNNHFKKNITLISQNLILPRPSVSREIHKMIKENLIFIRDNTIYLT